ncbi:hypothetical protein [Bacillus phage BillyBob]|nr:hypothetical protein [Bacillus phage BillyBob]
MREQHGMTGSRLYTIYRNMKQRCHNPKHTSYETYGAKGIEVCLEWRNSPTVFMEWALANGYNDELTIDRVDSTKGYAPDNCRWITLSENSRRAGLGRKRPDGGKKPKLVTYNGKSQSLKDWASELGVSYQALHARVSRNGGSIEKAFAVADNKLEFNGESKNLKEWSEYLNISYNTLKRRIYHLHWSTEKAFTKPVTGGINK